MHAPADRDRAVSNGTTAEPFALFANSLIDGMAGYLSAPASAVTERHLRAVGIGRLGLLL